MYRGKKLKNQSKSPHVQENQNNNPYKLQPTPELMAKKLREEEKEREKEKLKPPKCSRCGKQHFGLCPPRP